MDLKKRLVSSVEVVPVGTGFGIKLDKRVLKTPAQVEFIVPTWALAEAIAEEWMAQGDKIAPHTMPLTKMANAAIDKIPDHQSEVIAMLVSYGETDLVAYRVPTPVKLQQLQAEKLDPIVAWASKEFGHMIRITQGVVPIEQPVESSKNYTVYLSGLSIFSLAAHYEMITLTGSLLLGVAVARGHLTPEESWVLSRIEEDSQTQQWGKDDEALARAESKKASFLAAANFLILCGEESQ